MRKTVATRTQRGQVTVPADVRRLLGVQPRGNVTSAINDGPLQLLPVVFTLETAFAWVAPLAQPDALRARIEAAMEEHADEVARGV